LGVLEQAARPLRFRRAITPLALLLGGLIVARWFVWWFSFDEYRGEPLANGLFPVSTTLA
jgi:hypothetical protein